METAQEFIERKNKEFQKGKFVTMKDIGRKGVHKFKYDAWTFMPQHNNPQKVYVFERLTRIAMEGEIVNKDLKIGDIEYRIGYYMVGKIRKANGRWIWGQFCPLIAIEDFNVLIDKAKREGVLT